MFEVALEVLAAAVMEIAKKMQIRKLTKLGIWDKVWTDGEIADDDGLSI